MNALAAAEGNFTPDGSLLAVRASAPAAAALLVDDRHSAAASPLVVRGTATHTPRRCQRISRDIFQCSHVLNIDIG